MRGGMGGGVGVHRGVCVRSQAHECILRVGQGGRHTCTCTSVHMQVWTHALHVHEHVLAFSRMSVCLSTSVHTSGN